MYQTERSNGRANRFGVLQQNTNSSRHVKEDHVEPLEHHGLPPDPIGQPNSKMNVLGHSVPMIGCTAGRGEITKQAKGRETPVDIVMRKEP